MGPREPIGLSLKHPPTDFRGSFSTDLTVRESFSGSTGPVAIRPTAVATPVDASDVSTLTAWACDERIALTPRGAGTGMPGGNVGAGVLVDLSTHFADIGEIDQGDGTCWVGVGAIAAVVDRQCARSGLAFPPLPASAERCSIGGMIANNAAGPRSFKYGATRMWIEALDVVLPDGGTLRLDHSGIEASPFRKLHQDLTHAELPMGQWPATRKNSSGYALDFFLPSGDPVALLLGSEGTLATVTRAKLRLSPRPPGYGVAAIRIDELEQLPLVVQAAQNSGASACEFLARRFLEIAQLGDDAVLGPVARGDALVLLEVEGSPAEVNHALDQLRDFARENDSAFTSAIDPREAQALWDVRRAASPIIAAAAGTGLRSIQFIEDSVVPVSGLARYLRSLGDILSEEETDAVMFGHAGDGNVHVNPLVDITRPDWKLRVRRILDQTAELVAGLGGTLSGEHGDGRIRAPYLERIWGPTFTGAFKTVKQALDSAGIMNPGVIIPTPGQDPLDGIGDWT